MVAPACSQFSSSERTLRYISQYVRRCIAYLYRQRFEKCTRVRPVSALDCSNGGESRHARSCPQRGTFFSRKGVDDLLDFALSTSGCQAPQMLVNFESYTAGAQRQRPKDDSSLLFPSLPLPVLSQGSRHTKSKHRLVLPTCVIARQAIFLASFDSDTDWYDLIFPSRS